MSELEKQEQDFLELATQVNAWDRLLVENGEKVGQSLVHVYATQCISQ